MAWYTLTMPEIIPRSAEKLPEVIAENIPELIEQKTIKTAIEKTAEFSAQPSELQQNQVNSPIVLTEPLIIQKKVEHVLEEGLEPLFLELNDQDKQKFKALGETTAIKIAGLLQQAKVRLSEILILIKEWLNSLTGISKFYVEQEAKIKAEKLLKLRQEK